MNWYFREFVNGECIEFAYVQAGQENSFPWNAMKKGLELQIPLIAGLRDQNKIRVETLAESGNWFRQNYKVTPSTSVTVNVDLGESNLKTVWFNSRFYRINFLWENSTLRMSRDIHLFNEKFPWFMKRSRLHQTNAGSLHCLLSTVFCGVLRSSWPG